MNIFHINFKFQIVKLIHVLVIWPTKPTFVEVIKATLFLP